MFREIRREGMRMKLLCKKDVIMDTGERAFTKGKEYTGYKSVLKDGYEIFPVIKAKNDQGKGHIIKDRDDGKFLDEHFTR